SPAAGQVAPGGGHGFHDAAQLDLLLEQPLPCGPVLRRLAGKHGTHDSPFSSTREPLPVRSCSRIATSFGPRVLSATSIGRTDGSRQCKKYAEANELQAEMHRGPTCGSFP